jgi:hypothetical protein
VTLGENDIGRIFSHVTTSTPLLPHPYSVNLANDYEPRHKIKPYTTTNFFIVPLHNGPFRVSQMLFSVLRFPQIAPQRIYDT